ncbi:MAG: PAS domain S-box protein, partial [Zetaproteobacteria bacterium]|nr:PAS domain S-box protein [Zetaproteobacteria bacterium]
IASENYEAKRITEAMSEGLIVFDKFGHITRVNKAICDLLMYREDELIGMLVRDLFCDSDQIGHNYFNHIEVAQLQENMQSLFDNDSDDFYDTLRKAPVAMMLVDSEGKIVLFNDHAEEVFGYASSEMIGESVESLIPQRYRMRHESLREGFHVANQPKRLRHGAVLTGQHKKGHAFKVEIALLMMQIDDDPHVLTMIHDVVNDVDWAVLKTTVFSKLLMKESRTNELVISFKAKSWEKIPTMVSASPLWDDDGKLVGAVMIEKDMRAYYEALAAKAVVEEALEKSERERLEALGLLAGGVAHDFNNLLLPIMGHAELLQAQDFPAEKRIESAKYMLQAARQAARLSRQMLSYAGSGRLAAEAISPTVLISPMRNVLRHALASHVKIHFDLHSNLPLAMLDVGEVEQIVLNMVVNASDAMQQRETGNIYVTTLEKHLYLFDIDAENTYRCDGTSEGEFVGFTVQDDGCGMDAPVLKRIFDPFFTTKTTGRGLGMSAILGIVKSHGGVLHVESTPNVGSFFSVMFPVSLQPSLNANDRDEDTSKLVEVLPDHFNAKVLLI